MNFQEYPFRYLRIAGGFAIGGTTYHVGDAEAYVQIPAIGAAHLPLEGGISETKVGKTSVNCQKVKFPNVTGEKLRQLRATELASVGSGHARCQSDPRYAGQPYVTRTMTEIKSLKIVGGLSLKRGLVSMVSTHHTEKSAHPEITFGPTEISGLKLGKTEVKVTLDTEVFNKYSTLQGLEEAYRRDPALRAKLSNRFLTDGDKLHKSASGYVVGSIVKSIENLPKDAKLLDGYTIFWPPVGRIVLGEVLLSHQLRRVTLVRVKESCTGGGSTCIGGGSLP